MLHEIDQRRHVAGSKCARPDCLLSTQSWDLQNAAEMLARTRTQNHRLERPTAAIEAGCVYSNRRRADKRAGAPQICLQNSLTSLANDGRNTAAQNTVLGGRINSGGVTASEASHQRQAVCVCDGLFDNRSAAE